MPVRRFGNLDGSRANWTETPVPETTELLGVLETMRPCSPGHPNAQSWTFTVGRHHWLLRIIAVAGSNLTLQGALRVRSFAIPERVARPVVPMLSARMLW
jgi:hypothetical protein